MLDSVTGSADTPPAMSDHDIFLRDALASAAADVAEYQASFVREPGNARIQVAGVPHALVPASVVARDLPLALARRDGPEAVALVLYELGALIGGAHAAQYFEDRGIDPQDRLSRVLAGPGQFAWSGYGDVDLLLLDPFWDERMAILWESTNSISAEQSSRAGRRVRSCHMQAGYGAGWCSAATGLRLRAIELACRTEGAHRCRFLLGDETRLDELATEPRFHRTRDHYTVHSTSTSAQPTAQRPRPRLLPD